MKKKRFFDQLGHSVEINFPPQRIISLVPSQTELLFDLGVADRVVGITKFCVHPAQWSTTKAKVGGTKKFQFDSIESLKPDLIIGNKEENYEQGINQLAARYPVWMSDITSWASALEMIKAIGELGDKGAEAETLLTAINNRFESIKRFRSQRVLYLIWKNPWMAVGKNTFIDAMINQVGLLNCIETQRYPELSLNSIKNLSPEIIMMSTEPYPFQQKDITELEPMVPGAKIVLVDGEMFSWYGSRMLKAADYFDSLEL